MLKDHHVRSGSRRTFLGNVLAYLDPDPQTQLNPDTIRVRNTDFCRVKWAFLDPDSLALAISYYND